MGDREELAALRAEFSKPAQLTERQELEQLRAEFADTQPQPQPQQDVSDLDQVRQAILNAPAGSELAEFGAAIGRGAVNLVDFFTTKPARAIQQLAGVEEQERIPTLASTEFGQQATTGEFVEPGLTRDILRASGELVAPGVAAGGALRAAGKAIPAIQAGAQTLGQAVTRQLGSGTAATDVTASLLSGTGGEVGEEVGGAPGKVIGSLAAPLAPQVIKSSVGNAIKSIFRGSDKNLPGIRKTIEDFSSVGDVPTVAQATGRRSLQSAENLASKVIGGGRITNRAEQLTANIQARVKQIADKTSTTIGAEEAGVVIKRGITGKGGFVDRFKSKSSDLWNRSDGFVDDATETSITNTKQALDRLVRGGDVGKILDNKQLVRVREALEGAETVGYRVLRDLRTSIGQKISNNELVSDIPRAELKQLYGAITQDVKAITGLQGKQATTAFNRANKFTSSGHKRLGDFVERISKKVEVDKIFDSITKGGEGTRLINSFKRSLKQEEWEVVASNVVRRLGRASPGQQNASGDAFSTNKFLTDWNKLGKAKKALFSGSERLNSLKSDLDKIANVAEVSKESARAAANASGSGQSIANFGLAAATTGGAAVASVPLLSSIAATVTMNNMGARLMTNKGFVKWLAKNGETVGKATGSQVAALINIAKNSNLDDAIAIQTLVEEIEEAE